MSTGRAPAVALFQCHILKHRWSLSLPEAPAREADIHTGLPVLVWGDRWLNDRRRWCEAQTLSTVRAGTNSSIRVVQRAIGSSRAKPAQRGDRHGIGVAAIRIAVAAVRIGVTAVGIGVTPVRIGVAAVGIGVAAVGIGVAAIRIGVAAVGIGIAAGSVSVAAIRIGIAAVGSV